MLYYTCHLIGRNVDLVLMYQEWSWPIDQSQGYFSSVSGTQAFSRGLIFDQET